MFCILVQYFFTFLGAFDGPGAKTVIPRRVIGKFSIRLVPDQMPDEVEKCVRTISNVNSFNCV